MANAYVRAPTFFGEESAMRAVAVYRQGGPEVLTSTEGRGDGPGARCGRAGAGEIIRYTEVDFHIEGLTVPIGQKYRLADADLEQRRSVGKLLLTP
jgi:hypothetical protein